MTAVRFTTDGHLKIRKTWQNTKHLVILLLDTPCI